MLKEQIQKDYLIAFKNKDRVSTDTLGMLKAAIQYVEVEARSKSQEVKDEDIINIIQAEVKKRKEAIDSFRKGGREESAQAEEDQMKVLTAYLPKPLSPEELTQKLEEIIKAVAAKDMNDFGKVMKNASLQLKGKADGNMIKTMVEDLLKAKA
jgi:uncharacterized protein